jgi:hypothetical protein
MENQIPIPTDNIYKFYALFGLLIFIFGAGSTIYITHSTNDLAFQTAIEIQTVKDIQNPSAADKTRLQFLERRLTVATSDRKFETIICGVICGIGLILMHYGFMKWHKEVQPIQDEIAKLQLEKLRHEVKQLKHTISHTDKDT